MLPSLIIFLICYVFIASEKVDKTIVAFLGATAVICLHQIPYEEALEKVDLNVIYLLIGMMVIVNVLSRTGVFEWITIKMAQKVDGNAVKILILLLLVTCFFSAFLDNVTTVILIAPVTILITQILDIPTVPFLIMEAVFSNIGGTATLIGDPPNIIIGSATHLGFNDFLFNLGPIVLIIMILSIVITIRSFKKNTETSERAKERIRKSDPDKAIVDPRLLSRSLIVLGLVLLGFFLGQILKIEPGIIAIGGAMLMLLVGKLSPHDVLAKVEWNTILFFIGLFMLIGALEVNGVFEHLGSIILSLTEGNLLLTTITILWFSALLSAIVDNIPLVIAMIPLVKAIVPAFALQMHLTDEAMIMTQIADPLFWALALGACLGGNGSLIGASANVVVAQIARRNNYQLSFMDFTKASLPYMILSLLISTGYLYLRYFSF